MKILYLFCIISVLLFFGINPAEKEITEKIRQEYQNLKSKYPTFIDGLFYGYKKLDNESCPTIYSQIQDISKKNNISFVPRIYVFYGNLINTSNRSLFGSDDTNIVSSTSYFQYFCSISIGEKLLLNLDWNDLKELINFQILKIKNYHDLIRLTLTFATCSSTLYLLIKKFKKPYIALSIITPLFLWLNKIISNSQNRNIFLQIESSKELKANIEKQKKELLNLQNNCLLNKLYKNSAYLIIYEFYKFLTLGN